MKNTRITTNHKIIKEWVEERGGIPERIADREIPTENGGVLDIWFSDSNVKKKMIHLSWDEFFSRFDQSHLAFEYEDTDGNGQKSKFYKFVWRDGE